MNDIQLLSNDIAILRAAVATLRFLYASDVELKDAIAILNKHHFTYQKKLAEYEEKD